MKMEIESSFDINECDIISAGFIGFEHILNNLYSQNEGLKYVKI